MNILVVAAHPDDEVLGCGGTIARLADEGCNVEILILGEGITSRYEDPSEANQNELEELHSQANEVGKSLGAKEIMLHNFPDNRFDSVPLLEIVKAVEETIEKFQPAVIYTQYGGDLNIDHERTFRAVMTATRPMKNTPVKRLYAYEVPSSTEWSFQKFSPRFNPNVFTDISSTLERKIDAMRMYDGESREFPHPRSSEAITAHAKYWGSVSGLEAAEAFELVREIQ